MKPLAAKLVAAVALVTVLGALDLWQKQNAAGPVRILRFYTSVGMIVTGESAELCYGVENARSVRIAPPIEGVYPSAQRCVAIVPEHTTHYTILAEGFDGNVAIQSLTLPVEDPAPRDPAPLQLYAAQ